MSSPPPRYLVIVHGVVETTDSFIHACTIPSLLHLLDIYLVIVHGVVETTDSFIHACTIPSLLHLLPGHSTWRSGGRSTSLTTHRTRNHTSDSPDRTLLPACPLRNSSDRLPNPSDHFLYQCMQSVRQQLGTRLALCFQSMKTARFAQRVDQFQDWTAQFADTHSEQELRTAEYPVMKLHCTVTAIDPQPPHPF